MDKSKAFTRAHQLIALAIGSHSENEGRNAAFSAVKIINEHGLLFTEDNFLEYEKLKKNEFNKKYVEPKKEKVARNRRYSTNMPRDPDKAYLKSEAIKTAQDTLRILKEKARRGIFPLVTIRKIVFDVIYEGDKIDQNDEEQFTIYLTHQFQELRKEGVFGTKRGRRGGYYYAGKL